MPLRWPFALALAALFVTAPAWAGPDDEREANALYEEAIALVRVNRHAEACPKLERSQKLDPGLGTEYHLADCYEHVGRLATALSLYRSVANAARAADKPKLRKLSEERLATLTPKVPRLEITFAKPEPNAEVLVDGARTTADDARTGTLIDPGRHEIEVRAPSKVPFQTTITAREGETATIRVEELKSVALPPAAESPRLASPRAPSTLRPAGLIVGGAGVAFVVAGAIAGVVALDRRSDARAACGSDDPKRCGSREATGEWDSALSAANLSTVAFVAGGVLAATGITLWVLGGSKAAVTARTDASGGRLGFEGHW